MTRKDLICEADINVPSSNVYCQEIVAIETVAWFAVPTCCHFMREARCEAPRYEDSIFAVFLSVETQHCRLLINDCFEMHGTSPQSMHVLQGLAGVAQFQLSAFVAML